MEGYKIVTENLECLTPLSKNRPNALVEATFNKEVVFIFREADTGKYFNISRMFQYNLFITKESRLIIMNEHFRGSPSLVDKIILIHLRQTNMLNYFVDCAARIAEDHEVILSNIIKRRKNISADYQFLKESGFRYAIANYVPYKDVLLALYKEDGSMLDRKSKSPAIVR